MLKHTFVIQQVGNTWLAVPVGPSAEGISLYLQLNESSLELFRLLQEGGDEQALVRHLMSEYELTEEEARGHAAAFLAQLREMEFID